VNEETAALVVQSLPRSLALECSAGEFHPVPAHHVAAEAVDAYLDAAGSVDVREATLWQGITRGGALSGQALTTRAVLAMVKRRCAEAGLPSDVCNHSFRRPNGITLHQEAAATSRLHVSSRGTLR
jgi:hypothetical protein